MNRPHAKWRKSSYSAGNGNCVEVAETAKAVLMRDTQHRLLGHLVIPTTEWAAFLREAKDGHL